MKMLTILFSLLLSSIASAETPWLKKPAIYYYQEATTVANRVGSDEAINKESQKISDAFLKKSAGLKKLNDEKPIFLVVMFNEKGDLKYWVDSEDEKRAKEWEKYAKKALKEVSFKTSEGSVALAYYFGIVDGTSDLPKNPPILKAWYGEIDKHDKIGAGALFDQIMAQ